MHARTRVVAAMIVLAVAALAGGACGSGGSKTASSAAGPADRGLTHSNQGAAGANSDLAVRPGQGQDQPVGPKIVKTAELTLQVARKAFDQAFQRATLVASAHGGYVSTSQTSEDQDRSGVLVVRVPASQFEATLAELSRLGTVKAQRVSGEDVTAQFVDLQARLRNWRAQEAVLLRLMARSASIEDSLKVEGQLQNVQQQIEEITGQLRQLSSQADLSTITVSMAEAPVVAAKPKQSFGLALRRGAHGLRVTVDGLLVALGYATPFALLALISLAAWVAIRRLRAPTLPSA